MNIGLSLSDVMKSDLRTMPLTDHMIATKNDGIAVIILVSD